MSLDVYNITVDCTDAQKLGSFWSAALGRPLSEGASEHFANLPSSGGGVPNWLFLKVPESKAAKNRMHVDLHASDRKAEVARLVSLGATEVAVHDEYGIVWTVLLDPEGNEFCVASNPGSE